MPSEISWLVQDQLILVKNMGVMTRENLVNNDMQVISMLDLATKPHVHILIDDRAVSKDPTMQDVLNLKTFYHRRIGWIVLTNTTPIGNFILTIVSQVTRFRIRHANCVQEGLAFLAQVDTTLPDNILTLQNKVIDESLCK